jgi:formate hydrogenlyase subunit 6/NADH:ubiquinone oxidoreductase subunit I
MEYLARRFVMRLGTMFKDILQSLFKAPVTQKYPFERLEAPERLRGMLEWDPAKCSGCGLCAKDCPSDAIELVMIDRAKKQFVVRYHVDRCTFCAQCVHNCRFKCMGMSNSEWELASLEKAPFTVTFGSDENLRLFTEQFNTARPECADAAADAPAQPAG